VRNTETGSGSRHCCSRRWASAIAFAVAGSSAFVGVAWDSPVVVVVVVVVAAFVAAFAVAFAVA